MVEEQQGTEIRSLVDERIGVLAANQKKRFVKALVTVVGANIVVVLGALFGLLQYLEGRAERIAMTEATAAAVQLISANSTGVQELRQQIASMNRSIGEMTAQVDRKRGELAVLEAEIGAIADALISIDALSSLITGDAGREFLRRVEDTKELLQENETLDLLMDAHGELARLRTRMDVINPPGTSQLICSSLHVRQGQQSLLSLTAGTTGGQLRLINCMDQTVCQISSDSDGEGRFAVSDRDGREIVRLWSQGTSVGPSGFAEFLSGKAETAVIIGANGADGSGGLALYSPSTAGSEAEPRRVSLSVDEEGDGLLWLADREGAVRTVMVASREGPYHRLLSREGLALLSLDALEDVGNVTVSHQVVRTENRVAKPIVSFGAAVDTGDGGVWLRMAQEPRGVALVSNQPQVFELQD